MSSRVTRSTSKSTGKPETSVQQTPAKKRKAAKRVEEQVEGDKRSLGRQTNNVVRSDVATQCNICCQQGQESTELVGNEEALSQARAQFKQKALELSLAANIPFIAKIVDDEVMLEMLSGIGYSGEWFTSPLLAHYHSDTSLLSARQKPDTWENLQAKGLLLVAHTTVDEILEGFETVEGKTVFNIMFTYVGGLVLAEDETPTYAKIEGDRQIIDVALEVFPLSLRQKSRNADFSDTKSKTYACPMCGIVQTNNAKQHIVYRCSKEDETDEAMKKKIKLAEFVKSNRFLVKLSKVEYFSTRIPPADIIFLKYLIYVLGGSLVNDLDIISFKDL